MLGRMGCLCLAVAALSGCGITGNLHGNPGYADFVSPGIADTDREFALSLGPLPLKLARAFLDEDDDPEAAAILKGLRGVRIYVYEIDGDEVRVQERVGRTADRLLRQGWEPMVAVREDGEFARVMVRMDGPERIRGLVVMAQDHDELILVNLIGELRPEMFNEYMTGLDIDAPRVAIGPG